MSKLSLEADVEVRKLFCERLLRRIMSLDYEGDKLFVLEDFEGAIHKYSKVVRLALCKIGENARYHMDSSDWSNYSLLLDKKLHLFLVQAYANRASATMTFENYDHALSDAHNALLIDPKHVKSLVQRGRAEHGLQLYEKACQAYQCAVGESPEDEAILKLLNESFVALEQSRSGNYALTDMNFLNGGCGEIPSCADFVGPVDIRDHDARRGLFAMRSLEPGELLVVSNPLATYTLIQGYGDQNQDIFLNQFLQRITGSKRQMARVHALASKQNFESMEIPSMELFRPGSEWIPPGTADLHLNKDMLSKIVEGNRFECCGGLKADPSHDTQVVGLWILPAFISHSSAPNCSYSFVGTTLFVWASGDIKQGEELTLSCVTSSMLSSTLAACTISTQLRRTLIL